MLAGVKDGNTTHAFLNEPLLNLFNGSGNHCPIVRRLLRINASLHEITFADYFFQYTIHISALFTDVHLLLGFGMGVTKLASSSIHSQFRMRPLDCFAKLWRSRFPPGFCLFSGNWIAYDAIPRVGVT